MQTRTLHNGLLLLLPQAPAPAFYTAEPPQRSAVEYLGFGTASPALAAPTVLSANHTDTALLPQGAEYDTRCDRCTALQQLRPGVHQLVTTASSLHSPQLSDRAAASMQRLARLKVQGRGTAAARQSSRGVDCGASPIVVLPATAWLREADAFDAMTCQHSSTVQQQQQQRCHAVELGISSTAGMAAAHDGGSSAHNCQSTAGSSPCSPPQQMRPAWVVTGRELALRLQRRADVKAAETKAAGKEAMDTTAAAAEAVTPRQTPAAAKALAPVAIDAQPLPGSSASAAAGLCDSPAPAAVMAGPTGHGQPLPSSPASAAAELHGSPVPMAAVQQTPHQNPLFEAADAAEAADATDAQLATSVTAQQQHDAVQV